MTDNTLYPIYDSLTSLVIGETVRGNTRLHVSTSELIADHFLIIFPNPADETIFVSSTEKFSTEIFNYRYLHSGKNI
jgi:hypothetical protein